MRVTQRPVLSLLIVALALFSLGGDAWARKKSGPKPKARAKSSQSAARAKKTPSPDAGVAEARLIEIYRLIAQSQTRVALTHAENLVRDYPHFQLAQLVYGDLLSAQARPLQKWGDVPSDQVNAASAPVLGELRDESLQRLRALRERPAAGTVPAQFVALSTQSKHAIAVDASRSRLYLFENRAQGLTLLADYYISVGKLGLQKSAEGDLRTPLGVYFITTNLDPRTLKDFYGSGALPINYPNVLDARRGKTGKGIWLHGTPPGQFARAPQATDGCVVLANPDLLKIIHTVEVRSTPVVIAQNLQWVTPQHARAQGKSLEAALSSWQQAKSQGRLSDLLKFYSADFNSNGKSLAQWSEDLRSELAHLQGQSVVLKDLSVLHWSDHEDTMVVSFGEMPGGARTATNKRQYWQRQGTQWKIFFEGVVG